MALELAKLWVRMRGDTQMLQQDLNKAKEMSQSTFQGIAIAATGVLAPVAAMGKALFSRGVGKADAFEQMKIEMDGLTQNTKETEATLKALTDFAVKTPFEMPQLMQVSKTLMQTGKHGQDLMDTIKMLGDASGGTAQKFSLLSEVAMLQMQGRTMSMRDQDMRQLSSRGILMVGDFAKAMGKSVKEVSNMRFSQEEVLAVLKATTEEGGRNFNMMEKQSQTYLGLQSTLSDALGILSRKLVDPLMPMMKGFLRAKIAALDFIDSTIKGMEDVASGVFVGTTAFAMLGTAIGGAVLAGKVLGITLRQAIIGTGVGAAMLLAGAAIGGLVAWMTKALTTSGQWQPVIDNLTAAWDTFVETLSMIGDTALYVFQDVFGMTFGKAVGGMTTGFANWILYVSEGIKWFAESFKSFVNFLTFVWRNATSLLDLYFTEFTLMFLTMVPSLEGIWQSLGISIVAIWDGTMAAMKETWQFIKDMFQNIKALGIATFNTIAYAISEAWSGNAVGMDEMKKKFMEELAEHGTTGNASNPFKAFLNQFNETSQNALEGMTEQGGLVAMLEKKRDQLKQKIEDKETAFVNREPPKAKAAVEDDLNISEFNKNEGAGAGGGAGQMKAGQFAIESFGSKLQDVLLEGKGDKQAQMVDLLGKGNKLQEKQLEEQKKNKPGALAE
jgi:hypothetical protein